MQKNKLNKSEKMNRIALVLLITPYAGVILTLILFAVARAISAPQPAGNIINVILGIIGIVCVLGIFICGPIGIYLLIKYSSSEKS